MSLLVRLAAATLPLAIRERYREQWTADLRDAADVGISRSSIVLGSLVFAATLDSRGFAPAYPPGERSRARVLRGIAYTVAGLTAVFGAYVNGLYGGSGVPGDLMGQVGQVVRLSVTSAIAVGGLGGGLALIATGVLVPGRRSALAVAALATLVVGYGSVALVIVVGWLAVLAPVLLVPSGLIALLVWALVAPRSGVVAGRRPSSRRATASAMVAGVALVVAVVAIGTLDGLVWLPRALAPGYSLREIHAAMGPDLRSATAGVIVWAAFWLIVTAAVVLFMRLVGRAAIVPLRFMVLLFAGLASAAIFFHWFATFGMANSVSDVLPPYSGGARSVATEWLYFSGQLLLAGVIAGSMAPRPRRAALVDLNA